MYKTRRKRKLREASGGDLKLKPVNSVCQSS